MARISVYMTGGIAAYKAVSVVRGLQKAGHEVRVAMTANSERFVGPATLAALTKWPVLDDLADRLSLRFTDKNWNIILKVAKETLLLKHL